MHLYLTTMIDTSICVEIEPCKENIDKSFLLKPVGKSDCKDCRIGK